MLDNCIFFEGIQGFPRETKFSKGNKVFQGKQSFPKVFLTKMVFEWRATTQTKSIFSKKKNHFETKNAKFVSFQKMVDKKKSFFCLCRGPPFKKLFFVNHFLKRYFLFVSWPSLQKGFFLSTIFCLCRGPPFKYHFC